jgi:RNA ligase
MNYEFPTIRNISDVLPAIAGRDEFVVAEKEGYTVINYNVMMADTFPDVRQVFPGEGIGGYSDRIRIDFHAAIRRECRGIIFDTATGEIIRRPFHKFFNVNEREETQDHAVDLSHPHAILEKLDGSMIAPFIVDGQMIWGTKMGATDVAKPVEEFVKNNPHYAEFALNMLVLGLTPIFEWCSRKQRIVLDYQEDQLILTAIRDLKTGEYWLHNHMMIVGDDWDIPVVRAFEPQSDMMEFIEHVRYLEDLEGFVVRFSDGHMVKLKCDWYIQIHKAKEAILQDRNIVELILDEKLDDVKAHLPAEDRDRLALFEYEFNQRVLDWVYIIDNDVTYYREEGVDRKTFALEIAPLYDQFSRALIFKNFDHCTLNDSKLFADVRNTIRNNLTKTSKYEAIRDAWFPLAKYND